VKLTKNTKASAAKIEAEKLYDLKEASQLVKDVTFTKFDASVDMDVRLGVDPKKANQMVRGIATLPHGTGKELKVLVLCNPEIVDAAIEAGADYAGLDEYLEKIKGGWTDIDTIITSPDVMPKLGRYGKVLGPRGLMPNPKAGTVTTDIPKAVKEVKSGKIDFKVDKFGIIHTPIARASFEAIQISENCAELLRVINKLRPASAKGTYFKGVTISSTMSPGIDIDIKSVPGL
jgi:large subunit ribosomal protein L1